MAQTTDETAKSAEKAYAEAASEVKPVKPVVAKAAPVVAKAAPVVAKAAPAVAKAAPAETPAATPPPVAAKPVEAAKPAEPKKPAVTSRKIEKPAAPKPAAKKAFAKAAKRAARVAKAAAAPAPVKAIEPTLTVSELKEKIMATAKTTDFTKPIADVVGEFQNSAKAAYDKSAEAVTEMTEFTKGNVEAIVESSKIFAAGAQSLGKTYVEEAKSAYETLTADVKELAAVKSPTELFQLQGKILRRNFDTFVATSSKNTEAVMALANDTFAPLTGRVEVATEKLAKVA
jgi:phasin family protein